jgi:S-formylglutathione hydrolase
MESYITQELPALLARTFAVPAGARRCDGPFSMGGHGALTLALRHPGLFKPAVGALAPICAPIAAPGA